MSCQLCRRRSQGWIPRSCDIACPVQVARARPSRGGYERLVGPDRRNVHRPTRIPMPPLHGGEPRPRRCRAPSHSRARTRVSGQVTNVSMGRVDFGNEDSAYPQPRPSSERGFPVVRSDAASLEFRTVSVEFAEALADADFNALSCFVDAWGALVQANAFALPSASSDEGGASVAGQSLMPDRSAVRVEASAPVRSQGALDCLLCLLDALSETVRRVASVRVE